MLIYECPFFYVNTFSNKPEKYGYIPVCLKWVVSDELFELYKIDEADLFENTLRWRIDALIKEACMFRPYIKMCVWNTSERIKRGRD